MFSQGAVTGWRQRLSLMGSALLLGMIALLCAGDPATAKIPKGPFEIEATHTFVWSGGQLKVEEHVTGVAVRETEVFIPCGGTPPGLVLDETPSPFPPYETLYALEDPSGDLVAVCAGPPEIIVPLPHMLGILVGPYCNYEEGDYEGVVPTVTTVPATVGTSARETVSFDYSDVRPVRSDGTAPGSFCLVEPGTYEFPNPECAEFFDADLCATEYESSKRVITRRQFGYVVSRTPRCPAAKAAEQRLRKRFRKVNRALAMPGPQPAKEAAYWRLRRLERTIHPRFIGECR